MSEANPRESAQSALKQAERAARKGDLASAERWSKTAERMSAAAAKLASLQPSGPSYEEEEALRRELWERLNNLASGQSDVIEWRRKHEIWLKARDQALLDGTELPPEPEAPYAVTELEKWRGEIERGEYA
jgi:hypothetical protein